jgi:hypothetical protein
MAVQGVLADNLDQILLLGHSRVVAVVVAYTLFSAAQVLPGKLKLHGHKNPSLTEQTGASGFRIKS